MRRIAILLMTFCFLLTACSNNSENLVIEKDSREQETLEETVTEEMSSVEEDSSSRIISEFVDKYCGNFENGKYYNDYFKLAFSYKSSWKYSKKSMLEFWLQLEAQNLSEATIEQVDSFTLFQLKPENADYNITEIWTDYYTDYETSDSEHQFEENFYEFTSRYDYTPLGKPVWHSFGAYEGLVTSCYTGEETEGFLMVPLDGGYLSFMIISPDEVTTKQIIAFLEGIQFQFE